MGAEEEGIRLQKVLAQAGIASRRAAEIMIEEGRIEVNGKLVTEQGRRVDPERDVIRVDAIRSALAGMIASTRDSLLQIPARVAPVLAVETDAARVHDMIQSEIHQALAQLVASPDRITRIETEH